MAGGSLTRGEDDRWDDVCSGIRTEILKSETILHMDVCYIYVYFNVCMYDALFIIHNKQNTWCIVVVGAGPR